MKIEKKRLIKEYVRRMTKMGRHDEAIENIARDYGCKTARLSALFIEAMAERGYKITKYIKDNHALNMACDISWIWENESASGNSNGHYANWNI